MFKESNTLMMVRDIRMSARLMKGKEGKMRPQWIASRNHHQDKREWSKESKSFWCEETAYGSLLLFRDNDNLVAIF